MTTVTLFNVLSFVMIVLSFLLGLTVLLSDRHKAVNRNFFLQVLSLDLWIFFNLMADRAQTQEWMLLWSKLTIVGPTLFAYFFYRMSSLFPRERAPHVVHQRITRIGLVIILLLVPTTLNIRTIVVDDGGRLDIQPGSLYFLFLLYLSACLIASFRRMFEQHAVLTVQERSRLAFVLYGVVLSALLGTLTSLVLPLLGSPEWANVGPYFISIFIVFTAYAIVRFQLFGIRVIATQLFVASLCIFTLAQMFIVETFEQKFVNGVFFVLSAVFGAFLIRSVQREIDGRTKNERLARYLANANARLRELDKQKTEFVSIASHQLRAPVAAIRGYTSLVIEGSFGEVPKHLEEPLYRVLESGKRLSLMIDDFLNVTRIEQGRMNYHMVPLNIGTLIDTVFQELKLSADKKGLTFSYTQEKRAQPWVVGDEGKLKQIFSNLIDNAIKYTQTGWVKVSVRTLPEHRSVVVDITDSGIGIASEEIEGLFQKFKRAGNANEANVYGTGLGLYIAKQIVQAHNGWIHIASPGMGKGSTFTVELPLTAEART